MAEPIILKRCSKCKEIKPLSKFSKNHAAKDGHNCHCKTCRSQYQKQYRQTEKGKIAHCNAQKRYYRTEKGKIYQRNYQKQYHRTKKRRTVSRNARKRFRKRYSIRNPEKVKARHAVEYAIKKGQLPPIDSLKCSCGKPAVHYHHHKGYEPKHRLDVIPKCRACHLLHS